MATFQNHTQALHNLGMLNLNVIKNYPRALSLLKKAAQNNYASSQVELGLMYYKGLGVKRDYDQARDLFQKAAQQKSSKALFIMGLMYFDGDGAEKDFDQAEAFFSELNQISPNLEMNHFLRMIEFKKKNFDVFNKEVLSFLKTNADAGSSYSSLALGKLYYYGKEVQKDIRLAFEYFKKAASKKIQEALYYLGRMYFLSEIPDANDEGLAFFEKALRDGITPPKEYLGKADVTEGEKEYHIALKEANGLHNIYYKDPLLNLAAMYYEGNKLKRNLEKAIFFFKIAANQNLAPAFRYLATIYYRGEGVEQNLILAKEYFDKFIELKNPNAYEYYFIDYYIMFPGFKEAKELFNNETKIMNPKKLYEIIIETIPDYEKNNKQIEKLLVDLAEEENYAPAQHFLGRAYFLGKIFDKDDEKAKKYMNLVIHTEPTEELYFIEYYIMFGEPNNPEEKNFWEKLATLDLEIIEDCVEELQREYGENNLRLQELILSLTKQENLPQGPLSIHRDLLQKTKENYTHNTSKLKFSISNKTESLAYEFNPQVFSYTPTPQQPLATLEDVDQLLENNVTSEIGNLRNDPNFIAYFTLPLNEEGLMLQAIVQKYKNMGEKGKEKLLRFLNDLTRCQQGKNQAIWTYYTIESLPLCFAELKNITDWVVRLSELERPWVSNKGIFNKFKKSRNDLILLLSNSLKKGHVFRNHLTELKTKEATQLKALLGSIVNQEKSIQIDNREALEKTLLEALQIIVDLSDQRTFFDQLERLCNAYEIYPPASKFGDRLSPESLELLIQQLSTKDLEGRCSLDDAQSALREFIKSNVFLEKLGDFENEQGAKLRELVKGFTSNRWPVGLLNLMETAHESNIEAAIQALYEKIRIDKDVTLTWDSLKTLILQELPDVKHRAINHIVAHIEKNQDPHSIAYVQKLLGGILGLRASSQAIAFDPHLDAPEEGKESVLNLSLQKGLDLFHEAFTPLTIIEHLRSMIKEGKLSIIDPNTGNNVFWLMANIAGKEVLSKKYPEKTQEEIVSILTNEDENDITQLAIALLLEQLGIFQDPKGGEE